VGYFNEEDIILSSLKAANDDGLFLHFNSKDEGTVCDATSVKDFLDHSYDLVIVNNYLQYTDDAGDTHVLETTKGITEGGTWLSSKLPTPPFDVFQGDNLRKSEEAKSLFIAMNIKSILKDENYTKEFDEVCDDYDYITMKKCKWIIFRWSGIRMV